MIPAIDFGDLADKELVTLSRLAACLPPRSNGRRFTRLDLNGWVSRGRAGCMLRATKCGRNEWRCTPKALKDFLLAQASSRAGSVFDY